MKQQQQLIYYPQRGPVQTIPTPQVINNAHRLFLVGFIYRLGVKNIPVGHRS